ncbi:MAG: L-histidine N(alpha)-methyltransferase, partial [Myxococcota bacterium]
MNTEKQQTVREQSYRRLSADEVAASLSSRQFGLDVLTGLSEKPKKLPSRYFYDDEGSRLFSAICDAGDYYPTRCETEILETYGEQILEQVGRDRPINIVDLGAGDGRKTLLLLDQCKQLGIDAQFVPIDISEGAMRELVDALSNSRPNLQVRGLVADYFDGLHWLSQRKDRRNVVL